MELVITSALIPFKFDQRQIEYEKSINKVKTIFSDCQINVVECFANDSGFLKNITDNVFISNTHNENIKNKGVLELMSLRKYFDSKPNSNKLIIKLTGRYEFVDEYFKKLINANPNYEFYGKLTDNSTQIFTGCFAIRENLFRQFITEVDLVSMEKKMINFEKLIFDFVQNKNCFFTDKINLHAPIFGIGKIDYHLV